MRRVDPFLESLGLNVLWQRRDALTEPTDISTTANTVETVTMRAVPESAPLATSSATPAATVDEATLPTLAPPIATPAESPLHSLASLDMAALRERVSVCTACRLCQSRTQTVFGVGDENADWMVVGEGPGANEDEQGEPFVGQAGKLLDNMLRALSIGRESGVFIANVVKCRPPNNRDPQADEVAACEAYLRQQVALVKPKIIVALGRFAAQTLLQSEAKIGALRGTVHRFEGVPVVVTYHPAYLLRSLSDKAKAWEDLCLARSTYRAVSLADVQPAS